MTPNEFITKWRASELKERSASQEHFIDLCRLLDEPTPADADPTGETYCFERGARRDTGGDGWADVWKRHHFAWEYKGRRANLDAAFNQLRQYALALENPPLLIVSDMVRFRIRTNWTNSVSRTHEFELDDLADAATRDRLKWAFSDPERLRPGETRQSLTERVAASFASVAQALRERGHDPQAVAHFVNRLVFCMFADDVGLLPDHMFTRMLRHALPAPARFGELAGLLFMAGMRRSEVSALRWADVADAADGDGVLVTVRRSKTNQESETTDVRFVKGGVARAIQTLRAAASPAPEVRAVPLSPKMVGLRFQAAARAVGVERVTAHSGRLGLASELTSRGASTTDVMLAGNWKTSRMVAHYSAGATAERGAVSRYL